MQLISWPASAGCLEIACALAIACTMAIRSYLQRMKRPLPLKYPSKRTVLQCSCGKCTITLRNYEPQWYVQCNCYDCRLRFDWSKNLGCQYLAGKDYNGLVDGVWVQNAITDFTGEVSAWKLRDDAPTINMKADCCGTLMGVHHPIHGDNIFVTLFDAVKESAPITPKARGLSNLNHFDKELLPPFTGAGPGPITIQSYAKGDWRRIWSTLQFMFRAGAFWALLRTRTSKPTDRTFQDIIAGKPVKVVGAGHFDASSCHVTRSRIG